MNDPHVEALYYRFESLSATDSFDNANAQKGEIDAWGFELNNEILKMLPQNHYSTEDEARSAIESHLRNWEESAYLSKFKYHFEFKFDHSDIVDRKPIPGNQTLHVHTSGSTIFCGKVTLVRNNLNYPPPNINYQSSPLSQFLTFRLLKYRQGEQLLTTVAYTILSRMEKDFEGRKGVAKRLTVSLNLLNRIGDISSRADPEYGRKGNGKGQKTITKSDLMWLEEAIRLIILRIGEVEASIPELPMILIG